MITRHQETVHSGEPGEEKKTADEACRCKEVAEMKPRQLLRLMLSDLAFWKKRKKGDPGAAG